MVARLKNLVQSEVIKHFFVYSFGAIFLKGVSFFLIPIYTKILHPVEFGQLELINTLINILSVVFAFGLPQVVFINYYKLKKEDKELFLTKINLIYIILSLPLFIITTLILLTNNILTLSDNTFVVIPLALFSAFLLYFQLTFFSIWQLDKKAVFLTNFKVLSGIIILVLNIILVYFYRLGLVGILFSNFVVLLATVLVIIFKNQSYFLFKNIGYLSIQEVLSIVKMGLPFILSSTSSWFMIAADRWLIAYFLDQSSVGIYSVAFKFAVVFEPLLIAPVLSVYNPYIFDKFKNDNFNQKSINLVISVIITFLILSIASSLAAKFMIDKRYYDSLELIPVLVMGFSFSLLAQIFAALMIYQNKSKLLVQNVFISSIVNLIINIFLIKNFELSGVAAAFLLSNIVWFLLTFFQNYKLKRSIVHANILN